jgi:hypothetical protein
VSENEAASLPEEDQALTVRPPRSWFKTLIFLWGFRKVTAVPRGSPVAVLLTLGSLWLALWLAIDWWERQPDPVLYLDGIPLLAWYGLAVLGLAALLRSRSTPRPPLGSAMVLAAGLVPFPLLLMTVFPTFSNPLWFWCASAAVGSYALIYLARGLRTVTGQPQRMAAATGVVFIVGFVALSDMTNAIPDVWNPREVESVSDQELEQRETALFEQADRIDQALDSVHRDASPRPQGFFLGFAGVGDERVFAREIGLASRVIGERYATRDRQVSLINDERDLQSAPLASVSGLEYALKGLAAHMKLDRDVLFLAISSHGAPDPAIAVANSQFPLMDLSPEDLADALREAGIEWRVIIISACYAGGFIDSLRDAHTLVITAAAADRTSFGCSNDRDLTYFGEAFYRDAFPGASSLRDAFEKAKASVAARERAEGETPSNPQAFFGSDIERHLAGLGETGSAAMAATDFPARQSL